MKRLELIIGLSNDGEFIYVAIKNGTKVLPYRFSSNDIKRDMDTLILFCDALEKTLTAAKVPTDFHLHWDRDISDSSVAQDLKKILDQDD